MTSAVADVLAATLDEVMTGAQTRGGSIADDSPKLVMPPTAFCREVCGNRTFARPWRA